MLQILVSHNIRIRGANTPLKGAISLALTMKNPEVVKRTRRRLPTWGLEKELKLYIYELQDIITPRGFLGELKAILIKLGHDPKTVIEYRLHECSPVDFGWNHEITLRDYQEPAVEAAIKENGILQAPAGSGKTLMGLKIIKIHKQPALWLTHTKDLMYQTEKNAYNYLPYVGEIGILGDGVQKWGSGKLIIATVQTLQANPQLVETLKDLIGTVIIDEAHHFPAPAFIDVAGKFPAKHMIGLTATPERKDQLERYLFVGIGPKLYTVERDNLYEGGSLIKPEVRFVYTDFSFDQASVRNENNAVDAGGEDLNYTELIQNLIRNDSRAAKVAETILENAPNNYSIVLTESIRYCYKLRDLVAKFAKERFGIVPRMDVVHATLSRYKWIDLRNENMCKAMVKAGKAVDYKQNNSGKWQAKVEQYTESEMESWQLPNGERKLILQRASLKKIDILFATQLAREGLDIPHLTVGHMTMPKRGDANGTNSGSALEQEIGRIMRSDSMNEDKKAIWFDYVDYNVGVLQAQYMSRRKVYKRLGLKVPVKKRDETDAAMEYLKMMDYQMPY